MVAAGDIACSPSDAFNGADNRCRHAQVSDRVLALNPDVVAPLGDIQYEFGRLVDFNSVYGPTWGRFKSITRPAVGNHEYEAPETPQRDSAPGYFGYFGAAAAPPDGYYAYDIGDWRAIVLNTGALAYTRASGGGSSLPDDCHPVSCAAGSPQETWLRDELDSLPPDKCVVAYWHHPRYSSTNPFDHPELTAVYEALRDGGVELALTGHSHYYERFAQMDANDNADPEFGVREFVVGTGGKDRRFNENVTFKEESELHLPNAAGFGVLELELKAQGYDFRFVGENGTVRDSGSDTCHGRPPG